MLVVDYDRYKSFRMLSVSYNKNSNETINQEYAINIVISKGNNINVNNINLDITDFKEKIKQIKNKKEVKYISISILDDTKVDFLVTVLDDLYSLSLTDISIINKYN